MDCSIFDRVYAGMLKSASEFQTGNQDETIEYHFDPQLEKVVSKYHLIDVAGQGPDSQKIIRMVEWKRKRYQLPVFVHCPDRMLAGTGNLRKSHVHHADVPL